MRDELKAELERQDQAGIVTMNERIDAILVIFRSSLSEFCLLFHCDEFTSEDHSFDCPDCPIARLKEQIDGNSIKRVEGE